MLYIKKEKIKDEEITLVDLVAEPIPTRTVRADILLKQLKLEEQRQVERLTKIRADIKTLEDSGVKEIKLPNNK